MMVDDYHRDLSAKLVEGLLCAHRVHFHDHLVVIGTEIHGIGAWYSGATKNKMSRTRQIVFAMESLRTEDGQSSSVEGPASAFYVPITFGFVLMSTLAASVYASAYCRGLYLDGAYYLYRVSEGEWFYIVDLARAAVQALRQAPIVLISEFDNFSLVQRGQIFSLAMLTIPVIQCAVCWFVAPRSRKAWVLFPIMHLLVGVSATSFNAVGEAIIAASYFWPLLFLLLFRTRHGASQALFLLLCIPAFFIHEGAFPLMLILLLACAWRARSAQDWREMAFLIVSAALVVSIVLYEVSWLLEPRISGARELALRGLLRREFVYTPVRVNLPVLTGTAALAALVAIFLLHLRQPKDAARLYSRAIAAAFVLIAFVAICASWTVDWTFAPFSQVQARYHPVYVSAILGVAAVLTAIIRIPEQLWANSSTLVVIVALCIAQTAWDVDASTRWHGYTIDLQSRLARSTGLIPWQSTLETGDAQRDANWRFFSADWIIPILSII